MHNTRTVSWLKNAALIFTTLVLALPVTSGAATFEVCSTCTYQTITSALSEPALQDGDIINVRANTTGYIEPITVTKKVKLIGKTSGGANAWTVGTAGNSGGPIIKYINGYPQMISFQTDNIEMKGFALESITGGTPLSTVNCINLEGDIKYITMTYNTVTMGPKRAGISVDNNNTVQNASISYCKFIGPITQADSSWFMVGEGSTAPDDGGSVDGINLAYNTISQSTSELQLDSNIIKNVQYAHNTFNNSNGYIKIDRPNAGGTGLLQGITVTYNTFNNSKITSPFADEYAVLVSDTISEADAKGDWGENLAIHFNNILQDDAAGQYPIVGFAKYSQYTTEITTTHNWWNSTEGPRSFEYTGISDPPRPDVSLNAGFDFSNPDSNRKRYSWSAISGGLSGSVAPNKTETFTDPSINVQLLVKTTSNASGAGKVFAAKYAASPVATAVASPLPKPEEVYYDLLLYPSTVSNIEAITATIYYPTGTALASTAPVNWYSGITQTWLAWDSRRRTVSASPVTFNGKTYAGYARIWADKNSTNPSLNRLTGTPIALKGTAVTSTTTTVSTTTPSGGGATTSVVATTTTSVGGVTTTVNPTTTSSVKPTTTTTAPVPKLTVTPGSLNFGADKTVQTFTITNTGVSTLTWAINKDDINYAQGADWIFDIAPASGETNKEQDAVTVTISKAGLVPGTYTASIPISSDGGDKTVSVSMEVTQEENPALNLNPKVLYLKDTDTSGTIEIANTRNGTLVWTIGAPVYVNDNGIHWISSVTPAAGSTAAEKVAVSIEVNRDQLRGGIYIATIPVTSNGRNRSIWVVMFVARDAQQYPRTNVDPFILFLKKSDAQKTFTISNRGTGTLLWQLGTVKYHQQQQGWITSVSPQAGETAGDAATITVTVDSSSLKQAGLYGATIPVLSTGGNKNVLLYIWIPLLQYE